MSGETRSEHASEQVLGGLQNEMPLWLHILKARDPLVVPVLQVMLSDHNPKELSKEFNIGEGSSHPIFRSVQLPEELAGQLEVLLSIDNLSDGLGVLNALQDLAVAAAGAALSRANPTES